MSLIAKITRDKIEHARLLADMTIAGEAVARLHPGRVKELPQRRNTFEFV